MFVKFDEIPAKRVITVRNKWHMTTISSIFWNDMATDIKELHIIEINSLFQLIFYCKPGNTGK